MFKQAIGLLLTSLVLSSAEAIKSIEHTREFPSGSEVENLALRPSGNAVVVIYTYPEIFEVAPIANATPKLIHKFDDTHGVSSITASSSNPDEFFVITGNFSFHTVPFSPTPDSYAIHRLTFDKTDNDKAVVEQLATLDPIQQPNGMIDVPGTPYVLIADCLGGLVFRFNTETRELTTYFDNPLLKPVPDTPGTYFRFGVNGIKLARGHLYFSNTNYGLIGRIPATGKEDCLEGTPEVVAKPMSPDDFIVNERNGNIFIAENGESNQLSFWAADSNSTRTQTLVGGPGTTDFLGATAVRWAKGEVGHKLLVTMAGNFSQFVFGNFTPGRHINIVTLA